MATWNGEAYIVQQLESILSQLGPFDELIVSDDGSTDKTLEILESYSEKIRVVAVSRVGGVVKNFERALSSAKNPIIILSDQDDVWLPGKVDLIRNCLSRAEMLITNADVVDSTLASMNCDLFDFVKFRRGFINNFISPKYVGCCMAFHKKILDIALPFPSNIQWHDWYLSLIGELLYTVECSPVKTLLFRRHSTNSSNTGFKSNQNFFKKFKFRVAMFNALMIVLCRYLGKNKFKNKFFKHLTDGVPNGFK
jgi:glycosyltransferase involved in cell wall biosynthesis